MKSSPFSMEAIKIDSQDPDTLLGSMDKSLQKRGFLVTKLDQAVGWAQAGSIWPVGFGWLAVLYI